jgi:hypothetical protein
VAALYLLSQPDKEASSSKIAAAVASSIGSVERLGVTKSFKQIMLSDPCFVIDQRHVSEAWFSLNRPLLNPVSAINALWPDTAESCLYGEVLMQRSAAMALYLSPNSSSLTDDVARAVDQDVGSTKKLGINKTFRQVLEAAPGIFTVSADGQHLTLNIKQLLRQRQQQQQLQQPAPAAAAAIAGSSANAAAAAAASAATVGISVDAALLAEERMRKAAASYLLAQPSCTAKYEAVAAAVDKAVGSASKLGLTTTFKQVLQRQPSRFCFSADGELLTLRQQEQQQQHSEAAAGQAQPSAALQNRSSDSSSSSGGSSIAAAAIAAVWPATTTDPGARLQRAAALHLSTLPGYTSTMNKLAQVVDQKVGSTSKLGIVKTFKQVLQTVPDVFLFSASAHQHDGAQVTLNDAGLLARHRQQQQHQQQPAVRVVPRPGASQEQQQQQQPAPPPPPPQQQKQQQHGSSSGGTGFFAPIYQAPTPPLLVQQQPPPPPPPQQQQQQPAWQQLPSPTLAVLPLPEGLQAVNSLTAVECAKAAITIIGEQQQNQLQHMLQHLRSAKLCALDLEFAQPHASAAASSSSMKTGNRAASRAAYLDRLALLQLFVPAAAPNSAGSANSSQQQWPAAIYLVQVPEPQPAAAALLQQLQPLLEDAAVSKVMHDARWDSCVLQAQFGISLAGVLDTQLLAGLTNLAAAGMAAGTTAAADGSSSSSSGGGGGGGTAGHLGRVGLGRLYEACGFPHPTKDGMAAAFDANTR